MNCQAGQRRFHSTDTQAPAMARTCICLIAPTAVRSGSSCGYVALARPRPILPFVTGVNFARQVGSVRDAAAAKSQPRGCRAQASTDRHCRVVDGALKPAAPQSSQENDVLCSVNANTFDRTISGFLAAWNADHDLARHRHLQACWSDDGQYDDPWITLTGRCTMGGYMAACKVDKPCMRIELVREPNHHHSLFQCEWELRDVEVSGKMTGHSYGEIDDAGRILRLTSFFNPGASRDVTALPGVETRLPSIGLSLRSFLERCR